MLSSESVALQARLVQQLASLRKQELDYIINQYQSLGVQSALICGFIIGNWQNTYALHDPENKPLMGFMFQVIARLFFACTYASILAATGTLILTMLVSNWAPGVALRGEAGSMTRSLDAARKQSRVINQLFVGSLVGFVGQLFFACWMLAFAGDSMSDTLDALLATGLMACCGILTTRHIARMHHDFYGSADWADKGLWFLAKVGWWTNTKKPPAGLFARCQSACSASSCGGEPATAMENEKLQPLLSAVDHRLDNPLSLVQSHPDLATKGSAAAEKVQLRLDVVRPSACEMHGHLRKRVSHSGRLGAMDPHQWRDRYFLLSAGSLWYWHGEADFKAFMNGLEPGEASGARRIEERLSEVTSKEGREQPPRAAARPHGENSPASVCGSASSSRADSLRAPSPSLDVPLTPETSEAGVVPPYVPPGSLPEPPPAASPRTEPSGWRMKKRIATHHHHQPSAPERIDLALYEVVVDMYDYNWGFYLQRRASDADGLALGLSEKRHHWHLRAPSEALRLAWTEKLLHASRWAARQ